MTFGIRTKLFVSLGTLIALIAGVGFVGWKNTRKLTAESENLYKNKLQGAVDLAVAETNLWKLRYGFPQFLVVPEERQNIRNEEPQLYKNIQQAFDHYRSLELTPEEREKFEQLEAAYQRYIAARPQWFDFIEAGRTEEAADYRAATTTPFGRETIQLLTEQILLEQESGAEAYQQALRQSNQLTILLLSILIPAVGGATLLSILLGRNIAQNLLRSAKTITATSNDIVVTVKQHEQIANQQATAVNETTTTVAELEASCRQSAEQAQSAVAAAQQALQLTENGTQAVGQTVEEMFAMEKRVEAIAQQIVDLSEQASQIGSISSLVSDLASQTNMLALNSSVEATRAGEHGKGFAIIAQEIRKLADQSQQSADKISLLISEIQKAINATVMVTEEGTKTMKAGVQIAKQAEQAFSGVEDAANSVVISNQQVSLNLKQQVSAMQQIIEAMNTLNKGAEETVTGLVQTRNGTEQLNTLALSLQALV
jgi:methyl-accepting chemotaxis protein